MVKTVAAILMLFLLATTCLAADRQADNELTGTLKTNVKAMSPYLLEIDGGGSIALRGDLLKDIPGGAQIWIKGDFHSTLCDNRTDPTPAAMPLQWHIYDDIKECRMVSRAFDRPKEKQLQH